MLYVLIKVLPHASAKKKTERLKDFKFRLFDWPLSSDIIPAKGLKILYSVNNSDGLGNAGNDFRTLKVPCCHYIQPRSISNFAKLI